MDSNLSIVLVEDNDDLRELTCDALRTQGHRVVGLSCAEELQDLARGAQADVFLIDINLPGEDGLGLARRIRQVQPLVGIIIISARTDLSDKVVGYDSGADWYLSKPVHFEELAAALKSFARRRQAQRADDTPPAGTLRLQQLELQGPAGCVVLTMSERSLLTAFARAPAGQRARVRTFGGLPAACTGSNFCLNSAAFSYKNLQKIGLNWISTFFESKCKELF